MSRVESMKTPGLLDVTLRDGGYANGHAWTIEDAVRIILACGKVGVSNVEIGYFRPGRHDLGGHTAPAASCPPIYIEQLREKTLETTTLTVMAHQREVNPSAYRHLANYGIGMVRLPVRAKFIDGIGRHVDAITDAGMRASVNLIRISETSLRDICDAAALIQRYDAEILYLADSNGSLFPEDVTRIVDAVQSATARKLGFHPHDGLSMAFVNSLAAVNAGCDYLDASLGGIGKGGGNLRMELIVAYLRSRMGEPLAMEPLALAITEVVAQWRQPDCFAECESIVSGLLDLNAEQIESLREGSGRPLLSQLK